MRVIQKIFQRFNVGILLEWSSIELIQSYCSYHIFLNLCYHTRFYLESAEETKAIAAKKAAEAKAAIEKKKLEVLAQKAKAKKSFSTRGNKNTAVETARSTSVTGGVFGINQRSSAANRKSQPARSVESPPRIYKTAPRGVPTLTRWKLNRNQAISGLIYDSSSYDDGKRVTSAPLEEGTKAVAGAVVKSVSGSRFVNSFINHMMLSI